MKRPPSVTLIGALLLLQGALYTVFAGSIVALELSRSLEMLPPELAAEVPWQEMPSLLVVSTTLMIGMFGVVSSIGVLRLRLWGWLMAMIVQGVSMILSLVDYAREDANYVSMFLSAVIVFYLNQRHIRQVFETAQHQAQEKREAETLHSSQSGSEPPPDDDESLEVASADLGRVSSGNHYP